MAASNIGGTTIHSFAGVGRDYYSSLAHIKLTNFILLGLGEGDEERLFFQVLNSPVARDNWLDADVLVIDEISMLSGVLFDKLNCILVRLLNLSIRERLIICE